MRTRAAEFRDGARFDHEDRVATEEPLEIRVSAPGLEPQRVAVTMRTPGHDFELDGTWVVVREVVGRHNAVDKVSGSRIPKASQVPPVLVLSGRIGFELVLKADVSGVSAIVALGAPTSLALSLAEDAGVILVGSTRAGRCVVYAGGDRVSN